MMKVPKPSFAATVAVKLNPRRHCDTAQICPHTVLKPARVLIDRKLNMRLLGEKRSKKISFNVVKLFADANRAYSMAEKPAWCQPYTIILTGAVLCSGSLLVFRDSFLPIAVLTNSAVFLWWYIFLVLYPATLLENANDD